MSLGLPSSSGEEEEALQALRKQCKAAERKVEELPLWTSDCLRDDATPHHLDCAFHQVEQLRATGGVALQDAHTELQLIKPRYRALMASEASDDL